MNKYSLFDDVEDMLEDRLDIVDGEKVFNGVRLNEEFKKVLLHSKKVFMMDENKLINGRDLDYSNSIVYKISSKNSNKVYIGSTIYDLGKRLEGHKVSYYSYDKYRMGYCASYEIIRLGDYSIDEIGRYNCRDRKELEEKESMHIMEYGSKCVNVKDARTGNILVDEGERKTRSNEKMLYLFEKGKSRLRDGMTKDELIDLKSILLKEIKDDISNYARTLEWYEYWRLSNIDYL